ncbi:zinc finger protein [Trichonephila clavata]|uniref:Zinc finger protein n=1 Tax=Trichonephila clavata TaxID=2740835 RepID=A0A8X6IFB6_TRICU|nr:zinc finger protein [Trichonephila clavata]
MDESLPPKELPALDSNVPDQTENDSDTGAQSVSPQRQSSESENAPSPGMQEAHLDGRNANSSDENSENDERPPNRVDANNDGDSEVTIQQHVHLSSSVVSLDNESTFSCKYPGCNFTSVDAEMYLKHEDTHIDGGAASCDVCYLRFPTYANMRRHHLYMHQGIRTFECQTCGKRFLRKEQFLEHMMMHSKPRPYQCNFCTDTFSFRGQLRTHINAEHAALLDKNCHVCDFKASSPNTLKQHYIVYHLKQNMEVVSNDRPHDLIHRVPVHPNENGAIDLATVSQNFSFMAHYPSFSASTGDANALAAGPSDLSRTSKVLSLASPMTNPRNLVAQNIDQNPVVPVQEEENRHTCVSSLAASTTIVSPPSCQDKSCSRPEITNVLSRERVLIKPEPPELAVDDSQNSNVQPTSTMDLSTTDVVETTCVTSNEAGTSDTPCRRKVHKHSCTDDTGSESRCSPPNRQCVESQTAPHTNMKTIHTCRFRPYETSVGQRCREYTRHTCLAHRRHQERRQRYSDSDADRSAQNEHSDEERKVFYSRATSTNLLGPSDVRYAPVNIPISNDGTTETQGETDYYNRKNTLAFASIQSCTLTCVFCGIIFPDQTLYLLHRSLHSEASPWKCNLCGKTCKDKYDFNSHVISKGHY